MAAKSNQEGAFPYSIDYRPAHPLGNRHDAEIIAEQSGRPVEEFLSDEEKEARVAEQEGETVDDPDKNE